MVVDLKFSRFSEEPWGFRLTGGADFEFPLTVIKVGVMHEFHFIGNAQILHSRYS